MQKHGQTSELRFVAIATMRTTERPIHLRIRVDNPGKKSSRVRLASVAQASSTTAVPVRSIEISDALLGSSHPTTDHAQLAVDAWLTIAPGRSKVLVIELDTDTRYVPFAVHTYQLRFERESSEDVLVEASVSDAVRDPVRR